MLGAFFPGPIARVQAQGNAEQHALVETSYQEIVVTASFEPVELNELAASVSVIEDQVIRARGAEHLQDVLNAAPNVNFSAGASRGRFIQLRGIGERSQFVDPVNPSVGLMIDGIDMTGLGGGATLLDVRQIEILRGPQGTRYGANALAGMVNIRTQDPGEHLEGYTEAGWGRHDAWQVGGAIGGPLGDRLSGRIAWRNNRSDGNISNDSLDRDNTNNIDEQTLRAKLYWLASDELSLNLSTFYLDVDNGYDAFSLDNNRHTLSDEPGHDRQETAAATLKAEWQGLNVAVLEAVFSYSDSNLEYGYDEDWSYIGLCTGTPCDGWEYSSTDNYQRDGRAQRVELRALSTEHGRLFGHSDWVVGVYYDKKNTDLNRQFTDFDLGIPDARFSSVYEAENTAIYGELSHPVGERVTVVLGGRWEYFEARYRDDLNVSANPEEDLWGGRLSVEYLFSDDTLIYGLVSRGYKAGGVNGEALGKASKNGLPVAVLNFLEERLEYDTETLVNWEFGLKGVYWNDTLTLQLAVFYMDRSDIQLKGWINDGPSFVGYTDNASDGNNYGLEWQTRWLASDNLELFANIGWLETEFDGFLVRDADCSCLLEKDDREQAHAPNYQFNLGGQFWFRGLWFGHDVVARIELEGKDQFYFSDSHDQKSDRFELLNVSLRYQVDQWEVSLWGRNLSDEDYQVRGFYFGNDPRKFYANELYSQLGESRTFGANIRYSF